jgi:hypothetical protein
MEGSALLQLPEEMLIDQIHITENGLVIGSLPPLSRRVVRCVLNHPHRSIATIAEPCEMCPVQAVASSLL